MLDFGESKGGPLGPDARFTDLWVTAMATTLTGAILLRTAKGDAVAFFREGNPVHISGSAFGTNRLGELLSRAGHCGAASIDAALAVQASSRQLIGEIMLSHGDASAESIEEMIEQQIVQRLMEMVGVVEGEWQMAPGENEQLRKIGVPIAAWQLVLPALNGDHGSFELREFVDGLLGNAVRLVGHPPDEAQLGLGSPEIKVLQLLSKPRKPDQIERAVGNRRRARAILRLLDIGGQLERLPAKQAIPIPSTLKLSAPSLTPPPRPQKAEAEPAVEFVEPKAPEAKPAPKSSPAIEALLAGPVVDELKELHGKLRQLDHFELLGVSADTSSREMRMRWTALAKKFHPDALGPNKTAETEKMARDVISKINDAYSTLDTPELRSQYLLQRGGPGGGGGGGGGGDAPANQASQIEAARVRFEMGNAMLKKGDVKRARDYFHFAMANDANKPVYKAYYAWAIFADRKAHRKEAAETAHTLMLSVVRQCKDDLQVQFYAGKIFKAHGDATKATEAFKAVLEIDATHSGARSELRTLNAPPSPAVAAKSRGKGKGKKGKGKDKLGAFSKLFNRD